MQSVKAKITRGLPVGSQVETCDNSGAKLVKIFTVVGHKTVMGRRSSAGVGDLVMVSVKRGRPDMRSQVFFGIVVRQKKEYRRPDGMRIKFEDNACVLIDDAGLPKGTEIKGAVAREIAERFPKVVPLSSTVI